MSKGKRNREKRRDGPIKRMRHDIHRLQDLRGYHEERIELIDQKIEQREDEIKRIKSEVAA